MEDSLIYILIAIPFFFAMMGIEWLIASAHKRKVYELKDTVTNLSIGIGNQAIGLFFKVLMIWTMWSISALLEKKNWVNWTEIPRLLIICSYLNVMYYFQFINWFSVFLIASASATVLILIWWIWHWKSETQTKIA